MKKTNYIFAIMFIMFTVAIFTVTVFTGESYAAALNSINVQTDKTTIRPGEQVTVTINFGASLGAYTFDIAYDNAIFEYVTSEGGTANDTTQKVRVTYYDTTGGNNPRTNMSVTFRAKSELTTSNPTNFAVTAEGLANADATVIYDDITTPITINVTVEPLTQPTPTATPTQSAPTATPTQQAPTATPTQSVPTATPTQQAPTATPTQAILTATPTQTETSLPGETIEQPKQEEPEELPKTGKNIYIPIAIIIIALTSLLIYFNKRK